MPRPLRYWQRGVSLRIGKVIGFCSGGRSQRHFGGNQAVRRDGDWNGFVRIAVAGILSILTCVMQFGIIYAVDEKERFL